MKAFYGYIRVSTVRQGENGVSLPEQRAAIERYATRHDLTICEWFEEQQTAAKQGRPIFNRMLRQLRARKAAGVVIHKIDRSARNLKDWAALGELIDSGIAVHFTNESLDLSSTTGRLSADIQAVVAAHYIRNLRDETIKGFYGRLKQGILPMPAPIGYLDVGAAKPKILDPIRGPLMQEAFELYATGQYSLRQLAAKMFERGLRTKSGKRISDKDLSRLFNKTFYFGLISIHKTGESYPGIHEPLISKDLFDRVQSVLTDKYNRGPHRHQFLFRRLIQCANCRYSLVPERQKGHVYYRCQTSDCPSKTIREELIEAAVHDKLQDLILDGRESKYLETKLAELSQNSKHGQEQMINALTLQLRGVDQRLKRLVSAYISGDLEQELFKQTKTALETERLGIQETLTKLEQRNSSLPEELSNFLELAKTVLKMYETAPFEEKRFLLEKVTSNRISDCKTVEITLSFPLNEIAARHKNKDGGPSRSTVRTWNELFAKIITFLQASTKAHNSQ